MPVFLGVHDFGEAADEAKVKDSWFRYGEACKNHGAKPWKVYFNAKEGKAFCVTEAASAEDVRAAHADIDLALKDLVEVQKLG
ncbi:hypothetical protein A3F65_00595 [Candidatus Saccharibacteria bacterium RIFCSPHIGHO2_12_FULL_47_16b]|nr:MAG: hypothetical protein A3F65_00595 [Candidatus Saccharibacteria bacterium RIFCSPHIGHO2_12_FULL_47_16b]